MRRLLSLLALLLAIPFTAAGCGTDDVSPDALAQAAETTQAQRGVHITLDTTIEANGQKLRMAAEGDADFEQKRMRFEMDMSGLVAAGEDVDADEARIEQIMIGTTLYMRAPMFAEELDADWVKMDLQEVLRSSGVDFGQMMQMSNASPAEQLEYLRATSDLENLGEEELDGVTTTHYKGTVDLRKYPDIVPRAERDNARKSIERLIEMSGGNSTFPVEVWVDGKHLVRRQKMTIKQSKPIESTMTMDMRFSDYGKRVDIRPPEGEVKDVTDLAKEGAAGTTAP